MSPLRRRALMVSAASTGLVGMGGAWADPAARELLMVTAPLEPFILPPNHPLGEGMDIDLAREALMLGGGYRLRVEHVPWRRVLALLKAGQADFSTGVHETPERRAYLTFSRHYGNSVRYSFYTRRDSDWVLNRLADLKGRRLGLMAGAVLPKALQVALDGPIEHAVDLDSLLRMLAAGRVDVVVGNELPARWLVQQQPYGQQLKRQPFTFDSGVPTQMAFSRHRPNMDAVTQAMNRGLTLLAKEQRWNALLARYLGT